MRKNLLRLIATTALSCSLCLFAQAPGAGGGTQPGQTPPAGQNPANQPGPNMNGGSVPQTTPSKMNDTKFAKEAAEGGMAEVELGKLAVQKAASPEVKQFGQRMIDDHTKANDQLKEIASKDNIQLPDSPDSKSKSMMDKLSKLSGPAFDKAYMKDMVKDHEKDVKEFQMEAQNGSNADIKNFASSTLPILQEHLNMAKNVEKTSKQESK